MYVFMEFSVFIFCTFDLNEFIIDYHFELKLFSMVREIREGLLQYERHLPFTIMLYLVI